MSEEFEKDSPSSAAVVAAATGIARRKLIRAGLAAAPVMLALKSQSALANGTQCLPSVWSSFKAAKRGCLSHGVTYTGGTCHPYNYWATQNSYPNFCNNYKNTRFHSSTKGGTYCPPFGGTNYGSKNLRDICNLTGTDAVTKLAKHCTAMFLNCKQSPSTCPVDARTCQTIWSQCSTGGTWVPCTGATAWNIDDCNDYFDYVCGIPNARNPPTGLPLCT